MEFLWADRSTLGLRPGACSAHLLDDTYDGLDVFWAGCAEALLEGVHVLEQLVHHFAEFEMIAFADGCQRLPSAAGIKMQGDLRSARGGDL